MGVSCGVVSPVSPHNPTEMLWGLAPLSPGTTGPPKKLWKATTAFVACWMFHAPMKQ